MENDYNIDSSNAQIDGPIYEDISDPEDTPQPTEHTYFTWEPDDFTPGQSSTYLLIDPDYLWDIVTLENWDKRPVSLQMYIAFVAAVQQVYGQAGVLQLQQEMELHGVSWYNFGTIVKNTFDDRYVCLD